MINTISDMKKTFAAPGCQVYVFNNGDITIVNSAIESGSICTKSRRKARELLSSIAALGDPIPWSAINYLDGVDG